MKDTVKLDLRWEDEKDGGRWFPTEQYKHDLIRDFAKRLQLKTFIETGLCDGNTVRAIHDSFEKVYSIELSKHYVEKGREEFKNTNIAIIEGDSGVELANLLQKIPRQPVLFYLDAHYSGGKTSNSSCPVTRELEAIFRSGFTGIILIDDMQGYWNDIPAPEAVSNFVDQFPEWAWELKNGLLRVWKKLPNYDFLQNAFGVVHVGAGVGSERQIYDQYDMDVIWFEPDPTAYKTLQENIWTYPKQRAYQLLISDENKPYQLNVADNGGASSSVLEFAEHSRAWPNVKYTGRVETVRGSTLDHFFQDQDLNMKSYQALIVDAQGAELNVLRGATEFLDKVQFVEVESTDFIAYKNGATISEIDAFMKNAGFEKIREELQCRAEVGEGNCYNLVYEK